MIVDDAKILYEYEQAELYHTCDRIGGLGVVYRQDSISLLSG